MDTKLKADIEDIRSGIKTGRFTNEAAVRQGIVLRLLQSLRSRDCVTGQTSRLTSANEAPRVNEASHAMRRKDARGRTLAFGRDKAVLPLVCDL